MLRKGVSKDVRLLALCEGNPPVTDGFPSQKASNRLLNACLHGKIECKHIALIFWHRAVNVLV